MKRVLLLVLMMASFASNAQKNDFSVVAGFLNLTFSAKADVEDAIRTSDSQAGFFFGLASEFSLNEKWSIEPSVLYGILDGEGFLQVPILPKYYVNEKVAFSAGPQFSYILEDTEGIINRLGIDVSLGAHVSLSDEIYLFGRYAIELTNRTSGADFGDLIDPEFGNIDVKSRFNSLQIGLGYKF